MTWHVELSPIAAKTFSKLDRQTQHLIARYLIRLRESDDPRVFAKPLMGELSGLWRYRVGKYRLISAIQDERLWIEIIRIGKRDSVYD